MAGHVTVKKHVLICSLHWGVLAAQRWCRSGAATDTIWKHKHSQQLPRHLCRPCSTSAPSGKLLLHISLHRAAALPCMPCGQDV